MSARSLSGNRYNTNMLSWFRIRQRRLTQGLVLAFMGAWLSLVCQNCMAGAATAIDDSDKLASQHCMQDETAGKNSVTDLSDIHSKGLCDCNETVATFSNHRSAAAIDKIQNVCPHNPPNFIQSSPLTYSIGLQNFSTSRSISPERAHYLPFERFCVLLI